MKISEQHFEPSNGAHYFEILFKVLTKEDLKPEQWYEVNHKIEDLIEEIQNRES